MDEPAALLLSPEQADLVRGALRQRLLTAQLAMLMRQPAVWKSELDNVGTTLAKYFDNRSPDTVAAQGLARELAQTDIAVRLPDVSDSLAAVAALRAAGFKTSEQGLRPMRTWFWTLPLAVVAVALAVVLRSHSGNVLLLVWPWRIGMSPHAGRPADRRGLHRAVRGPAPAGLAAGHPRPRAGLARQARSGARP